MESESFDYAAHALLADQDIAEIGCCALACGIGNKLIVHGAN
jgi:hypothetical protein